MLMNLPAVFTKYNIAPAGVLHVGANIGEEAALYDSLGIKKVIWIEANSDLFPKLTDNISRYPDHVAYHFAAGNVNQTVTLNIASNGGQSSSLLEMGTHQQSHPDVHYIAGMEVGMFRIDHDLGSGELNNCDFLNVDVQGVELQVLQGMGKLSQQFRWAYTEVNQREVYQGCTLIDSLDAFMMDLGLRRVETVWVGDAGMG